MPHKVRLKRNARGVLAMVLAAGLVAVPTAVQAQEITFADVVRDPSNAELNYNYAVQQMTAGDLVSAAAALERILLTDPNRHDVRLLYAVVLFRMNDLQAADRELVQLEGANLSADLAADYDYYRARVQEGRQSSRVSGQFVAGIGYDDTVLGTLSDFFGFVNAESDGSAILSGNLQYEKDLSDVRDLRFVAGVQAFTKQYFDFDSFSYAVLAGNVGLEGTLGSYDVGGAVTARTTYVDGEQYVTATGVSGKISRDLSATTTVALDLIYDDLDFDNIEVNGFQTFGETGRSGEEFAGVVSIEHRYTPRLAVGAQVGLLERTADQQAFEYDGWSAGFSLDREWGRGTYTEVDYAYQQRDYSGQFVQREEDLHYVRASLGAPLKALLGGGEGATLQDLEALTVEGSVFYERRDADAPFGAQFFEYDNTGAQLRFVWGFGQ
ncbi:tetratricopeptide repeat protein [Parvularcula sp. IMCC14364]|uniref:tetratricopeptide repeat protein n=1 Tax=Parvularcula sp. IMCC14364 TaxID=3067902 RepID=UPI002741DE6E|nr:tetratricopeptide repeat protein [Parvularcula sp. IMCC14364]